VFVKCLSVAGYAWVGCAVGEASSLGAMEGCRAAAFAPWGTQPTYPLGMATPACTDHPTALPTVLVNGLCATSHLMAWLRAAGWTYPRRCVLLACFHSQRGQQGRHPGRPGSSSCCDPGAALLCLAPHPSEPTLNPPHPSAGWRISPLLQPLPLPPHLSHGKSSCAHLQAARAT
jgi:hypothetical protein